MSAGLSSHLEVLEKNPPPDSSCCQQNSLLSSWKAEVPVSLVSDSWESCLALRNHPHSLACNSLHLQMETFSKAIPPYNLNLTSPSLTMSDKIGKGVISHCYTQKDIKQGCWSLGSSQSAAHHTRFLRKDIGAWRNSSLLQRAATKGLRDQLPSIWVMYDLGPSQGTDSVFLCYITQVASDLWSQARLALVALSSVPLALMFSDNSLQSDVRLFFRCSFQCYCEFSYYFFSVFKEKVGSSILKIARQLSY